MELRFLSDNVLSPIRTAGASGYPPAGGAVLGAVGPGGGALLDVADAGNSSPLLNCRVEREVPRRGG